MPTDAEPFIGRATKRSRAPPPSSADQTRNRGRLARQGDAREEIPRARSNHRYLPWSSPRSVNTSPGTWCARPRSRRNGVHQEQQLDAVMAIPTAQAQLQHDAMSVNDEESAGNRGGRDRPGLGPTWPLGTTDSSEGPRRALSPSPPHRRACSAGAALGVGPAQLGPWKNDGAAAHDALTGHGRTAMLPAPLRTGITGDLPTRALRPCPTSPAATKGEQDPAAGTHER